MLLHTERIIMMLTKCVVYIFVNFIISRGNAVVEKTVALSEQHRLREVQQQPTVIKSSSNLINPDHKLQIENYVSDKQPEQLVLVVTDWASRKKTINWMVYAERSNYTDYLIICLDQSVYNLLGSWRNGLLFPLEHENRLYKMQFRHHIIYEFLKLNVAIVYMDIDCVLFHPDALANWIYRYRSSADLIVQMGWFPNAIRSKYGAVACTGLFAAFPTSSSIAFFQNVSKKLFEDPGSDDQAVFNSYLVKFSAFGIMNTNIRNDRHPLEMNTTTLAITGSNSKNSTSLKVGWLPYSLFPRVGYYFSQGELLRWKSNRRISPLALHNAAIDRNPDICVIDGNESLWMHLCTASEFEDYMLMLQRESLSIVRKWTWNEKEKKETSESDLFFYFPPKVIEEEHSSSQNMLDQKKKMKSTSGRTIFNSCR